MLLIIFANVSTETTARFGFTAVTNNTNSAWYFLSLEHDFKTMITPTVTLKHWHCDCGKKKPMAGFLASIRIQTCLRAFKKHLLH